MVADEDYVRRYWLADDVTCFRDCTVILADCGSALTVKHIQGYL